MPVHYKFTVERLVSCSVIACDFKQKAKATCNNLINDMQCQSFKLFSKLPSNRPAFKTERKNATSLFIQNTQYCMYKIKMALHMSNQFLALTLLIGNTPASFIALLYNMCTRQYMLQVSCLSETNVKDITNLKPRLYSKHITQSVHNLTTHVSTTATHGDPCVYD